MSSRRRRWGGIPQDQVYIFREEQNCVKGADQARKSGERGCIQKRSFFFFSDAPVEGDSNRSRAVFEGNRRIDAEIFRPPPNDVPVSRSAPGPGYGKVIYGFQQVRLAHAVFRANRGLPARKLKFDGIEISIVDKLERRKVQNLLPISRLFEAASADAERCGRPTGGPCPSISRLSEAASADTGSLRPPAAPPDE